MTPPKRILVCGDRDWKDREAIQNYLRTLPKDTVIIHGDCRGADRMAAAEAGYLGLEVIGYPADWTQHGRRAGPIRNQRMLDEGRPGLVVAFHANIDRSRGTRDMVRRAQEHGIPTKLVTGRERL